MEFCREVERYKIITRSMSRKGKCWDNAVAESFSKTLKKELIYQNRYETRKQTKLSIFEYIEEFYNTYRRHKNLENRTILEFNQPIINKFKIAEYGLRKFVHFFCRKFKICLVVYRDNVLKQTQLYRITDREHYEELKKDLENILNLGIKIGGITCDGDKSLRKAIRKVCPKVLVQRCLVYIQRLCKIRLSAYPKSVAGFELNEIVCKIHFNNNEVKKQYWIKEFLDWSEKHKEFLNEKSYSQETGRYCYTLKKVRRCFSVIRKALPNMFIFLQNPKISKTTNRIESFFGHLKGNLNIHRGVTKSRRKRFIQWYLFYKNQNLKRIFLVIKLFQ